MRHRMRGNDGSSRATEQHRCKQGMGEVVRASIVAARDRYRWLPRTKMAAICLLLRRRPSSVGALMRETPGSQTPSRNRPSSRV
jgi:hypothetical protein